MGQEKLLCHWAQLHITEIIIKPVANRTLIPSVFLNDWQLEILQKMSLKKPFSTGIHCVNIEGVQGKV